MFGLVPVLAPAIVLLAATVARADDVDQAIRNVVHLDQRVHIMALEFNEAPRGAADLPDRQIIDAQGLLGLGRNEEAITLLLDVIVRWPRTLAARDATFLLADTLYQLGDLMSARRSYEKAVSTFTGTRREQKALVRLIEIALRTGNLEHVDRYLDLLALVNHAALEPAVAYAKGKVFYYRDNLDEAMRIFASIPPASAYAWRARYFMATIMVKRGDLGGAATVYETLLGSAAPDAAGRDVQDQARLALGRINAHQGRTERATAYYQSIPSSSKALGDGLYELGWIYVQAKEFEKARDTFARLLRVRPDGPEAPEVKLLVANLHLRQGDFALARVAFSSARDELEPAYRKLRAVTARSQADPVFLETLTDRSVEELDLAAFLPASARQWVRADPDVERLLRLARDVVSAQKEVSGATNALERVEGVLADANGRDRLTLFLDLGRARHGSTEVLSGLLDIRGQFIDRARRLEQPRLTDVEVASLDLAAAERNSIERQLGVRSVALTDVARAGSAGSDDSDDSYGPTSTIPPGGSRDNVGQLRAVVLELEDSRARADFGIAEAQQAANPALVSGVRARAIAGRLLQIFEEEQQVQEEVLMRLTPAQRKELARDLEVVSRADAGISQLFALDARFDAEADARVAVLQDLLAGRRRDVAVANGELTLVVSAAQDVGETLARVVCTRVADRLYDVIIRADVGLIDVAWGVKERNSVALRTIMTRKHLEEEALDEELARQKDALSHRFKAESAWARAWTTEQNLGMRPEGR